MHLSIGFGLSIPFISTNYNKNSLLYLMNSEERRYEYCNYPNRMIIYSIPYFILNITDMLTTRFALAASNSPPPISRPRCESIQLKALLSILTAKLLHSLLHPLLYVFKRFKSCSYRSRSLISRTCAIFSLIRSASLFTNVYHTRAFPYPPEAAL